VSPHSPNDPSADDAARDTRRGRRRTRRTADRLRRARAAVGASLRDFVDSLAPTPELIPLPVRPGDGTTRSTRGGGRR